MPDSKLRTCVGATYEPRRVLPAAQHQAAEATARLVLDAARHDRNNIATVARRMRVTARRLEDIASHADGQIRGHRSSPTVSRTPESIIGRSNN